MTDTRTTGAPAPEPPTVIGAPKNHWYHAHGFHLGAGVLASWAYSVAVGITVPIMSGMKLDTETNLNMVVAWSFASILYSWRKGKRITAIIDRKSVLTGRTAKWEIFWLFLPYLAVLADVGLRLGTSIRYDVYQWTILVGTAVVTTFVLDINSSFITDLLKAAPIAERLEHESR